jgi:hypothetical protein
MRRVGVAVGTLCDTAVCEFPPGRDAIRVLERYAGAGVITPLVDLDILGDDAARTLASG